MLNFTETLTFPHISGGVGRRERPVVRRRRVRRNNVSQNDRGLRSRRQQLEAVRINEFPPSRRRRRSCQDAAIRLALSDVAACHYTITFSRNGINAPPPISLGFVNDFLPHDTVDLCLHRWNVSNCETPRSIRAQDVASTIVVDLMTKLAM